MYTARLINRGHDRPRLSALTTRMGLRRAINSGKFTDDQVATLRQVLADDDLVEFTAVRATDAGLQDPDEPTTPKPKRDWAGFFQAFGDFLVKVIPVLIDLIKQIAPLFGGLASAAPAPTADLADVNLHAAGPDTAFGIGTITEMVSPAVVAMVEALAIRAAKAAVAELMPDLLSKVEGWLNAKNATAAA